MQSFLLVYVNGNISHSVISRKAGYKISFFQVEKTSSLCVINLSFLINNMTQTHVMRLSPNSITCTQPNNSIDVE